jgi:membrane protease YdiL (CAAX protease family)
VSSVPPPRSGQEPERPEPSAASQRFIPPVSPTPAAGPAPVGGHGGGQYVYAAPDRRPSEERTAWRPWSAPLALFGAFVVAFLGQAVILAVGSIFGMDVADPSPAANIVATLFQDFAFVAVAVMFARSAGRVTTAQFGLKRTPFWPAVGWTALAGLSFYVLSGLWAALMNLSESDELPDSLGVERSTVALVAVCVLVTVVAPLAEEFLFRGYFFGALRNWKGVWPAAVITGVVFGGIHVGGTDVEFLPPLMVLGFILCVLRWKTGSLLPCIALHAFNNAIAFGVTAADWPGWAVLLLIVGAVTSCMLICLPLLGRGTRAAAGAVT